MNFFPKGRFFRILSSSLPLLAAVVFSAQAEPGDPVLSKIREKYSGYSRGIQDSVLEQEVTLSGAQEDLKRTSEFVRKGEKFRVYTATEVLDPVSRMTLAKTEAAVIHDGQRTWMISPFAAKKELPPDTAKAYALEEPSAFLEGPARLVGSDQVGGKSCYVLETSKDGLAFKLWIEQGSFDILQTEMPSAEGAVRTVYSDFRQIRGDWRMPYSAQVFRGGKPFSSMTVRSFRLNAGAPDRWFDAASAQAKPVDVQ